MIFDRLRNLFKGMGEDKIRAERMLQVFLQVKNMSIQDARQDALEALHDGEIFRCTPSSKAPSSDAQNLNDSLIELFAKYDSIELANVLTISRQEIVPVTWRQEYIQIGFSHNESASILPAHEPIYVDVAEVGETDITYLSVFHWILTSYRTNDKNLN